MEKQKIKKIKGIVKWFSPEKGFGFIYSEQCGDIFVYFNDILTADFKTLAKGQKVQFDIINGERGAQASNVTII